MTLVAVPQHSQLEVRFGVLGIQLAGFLEQLLGLRKLALDSEDLTP